MCSKTLLGFLLMYTVFFIVLCFIGNRETMFMFGSAALVVNAMYLAVKDKEK